MGKKIKNFFKENWKFLGVLLAIVLIFRIELPYKIYTPGGMVDLSKRVSVESGYHHDGVLGMSYVSVIRGSAPFLLLSYLISDWDIVPESEITYANESFEETFEADKILTKQSIDGAIISAYHEAGKEVSIEKEIVHVTHIDENAQTELKLFDIILSVEDTPIKNTKELKQIVSTHHEGDKIKMKILRDNEEREVESTIYNLNGEPKVGVVLSVTYEYEENPKAVIEMKESESGPSGGLMMALAIYNSLSEEDITKGNIVMGTGTIDTLGNVGEIGGVRYKLIGAVKKKAKVFLVPVENYEETVAVKNEKNYDIQIIAVKTLKEALEALEKL